jgi:hypothetical protein
MILFAQTLYSVDWYRYMLVLESLVEIYTILALLRPK